MTMKDFTVVDANGNIARSGVCQEETFEAQAINPGEVVYEGNYHPFIYYRKNGEFHKIPDQPSKMHVWDKVDCEWKATKTYTLEQVRLIRNAKLKTCDWTDTVSAQSRLSAEELQAWQAYRQALRDITNDLDLSNVVWPTPPHAPNAISVDHLIEQVMYG